MAERKPLKEAAPSPKKRQATQKTHLLRDLRSSATPAGDHAKPPGASIAPEDLTPEALALRLEDLEAALESVEIVNWRERYSRAEQELSIKDRHDFKNLTHNQKIQLHRKAQQQYKDTIAEIRQDRAEHEASMTQLRKDIAMLRRYLSQRDHALVDIKRRKLELLKRRDALAVEMAQLRAGKQLSSSQVEATPHAEAVETSGGTTSTASIHSQFPSPTDLSSNDTDPAVDANTVHFDIHKLRLHMPGNIVKIDSSLTIDLTPQTTIKQLREQLAALQARLREFHPPLDTLPGNIKLYGKGPNSKKAYMLKTCLRILVSRYQAKTGVYGEPVEVERQKGVRELSDEAKERMARRWNEKFGEKRGVLMNEGNLERGGGKLGEAVVRDAARPIKLEDHDEMGLMEDECATEEESLVLQGEPEPIQTAKQASESGSWRQGIMASQGSSAATPPPHSSTQRRAYSTRVPSLDTLNASLQEKEKESAEQPHPSAQPQPKSTAEASPPPHLPHLTSTGTAHMVPITHKPSTSRTAIAVGTVYFSNPTPLSLITSNSLKKGDVLSVSRIAGIMAAKKCPEIVPLCHPIMLTHVGVELRTFDTSTAEAGHGQNHGHSRNPGTDGDSVPAPSGPDHMGHGGVQIECTVACAGSTGVEMEALTAIMGTALSVVDMCKAVDKFQRIGDVRVVLKEGGKSGVWREEGWMSWQKKG